ncbi:MAG: CNNM domain-containing protein, partial [Bacteroidota bacterium]
MEEDIDSFSRALLQIQDTTFFNSFSIEAVIGLAVLLLLILLSAVISGSETAFFSLVPEKLKREKSQEPVNRLILKLLDKPQKLLATILISNNFINVGIVVTGVFISEQLFNLHMNPVLAFIIQVVLLTAVLLLFGEIMPKIYAANATLKFASFMARPLLFLRALFSPLSSLLVSSTRAIDKRIKRKGHEITMEDINSAIDLTRTAKQSPEEDEEQKILKGIAKFGNIEVKEIMKSRVDVVAIEESE